ncbi:MAG: endonuclease/exonuclease/phosphatase family protein [Ichthyobacteriaceae bacterium]|nr:endonuclease/exonuclease/phosphatase family protein [Ichthyobacteriaceae bacterium]
MKRVTLVILLFISVINGYAQTAIKKIIFDGTDSKTLYPNHSVTSENNKLVLDLSKLARNRTPVHVNLKKEESPRASFSSFAWVKAKKGISQSTVILSNKLNKDDDGWEIRVNNNGAWVWRFVKNKTTVVEYKPTVKRQTISDGKFHLIGFTYDYTKNQAWLYYDGENVGVINVGKGNLSGFNDVLIGGVGTNEQYSFNGYIKSFYLFDQQISHGRILQLYRNNSKYSSYVGVNGSFYQKVKFLTWNVSNGGKNTGENIGPERVYDVIKKTGAEVIALQEADGIGAYLADMLDYNYYEISKNLAILSKFPFIRTVKIFRPETSGGVEIAISKSQYVYFFNVNLNQFPDCANYSNKYSSKEFTEAEALYRGKDLEEILKQIKILLRPRRKTSIIFSGQLNSLMATDYGGKYKDYQVSGLLHKNKYKDSYREFYSDTRIYRGVTKYEKDDSKRTVRIDYLFFKGNKLQVSDSRTIKKHPVKFPSNSSGVLTEFKWKK